MTYDFARERIESEQHTSWTDPTPSRDELAERTIELAKEHAREIAEFLRGDDDARR